MRVHVHISHAHPDAHACDEPRESRSQTRIGSRRFTLGISGQAKTSFCCTKFVGDFEIDECGKSEIDEHGKSEIVDRRLQIDETKFSIPNKQNPEPLRGAWCQQAGGAELKIGPILVVGWVRRVRNSFPGRVPEKWKQHPAKENFR